MSKRAEKSRKTITFEVTNVAHTETISLTLSIVHLSNFHFLFPVVSPFTQTLSTSPPDTKLHDRVIKSIIQTMLPPADAFAAVIAGLSRFSTLAKRSLNLTEFIRANVPVVALLACACAIRLKFQQNFLKHL